MRLRAACWLLPCAPLLWACAPPHPCRLDQVANIPLLALPGDSRVEVPIEVDRRPAHLLLDTGADTTVLTDAAFHNLAGLERDDRQLILAGVGGIQLAHAADLWRFSLGRLSSTLSVAVLDDSILPPIPPTDGLLGLDAFDGDDIDLDVAGGRLGVYHPSGGCSTPTTTLDAPVRVVPLLVPTPNMRKPRLWVTVAGVRLIAELDTGAPRTVLFAAAARRLGYLTPGRPTVRVFGVGGPTRSTSVVLSRIRLGPFNLHDMPADVLDELPPDHVDLLLGMDVAHYLHIWLSKSSNSLILQYPPRATGPSLPPASSATDGPDR